MARLTRREVIATTGTGMFLGSLIALATAWMRLPVIGGLALCVLFAAGLGAALAQRKGGQR